MSFQKINFEVELKRSEKKLLQDVNFETIKKKNAVVQMGGGSPIMQAFFDDFAQDS